MRSKIIIATILAIIATAVFSSFAAGQAPPPAPYAGLKNPFGWNDVQAQQAGKNIYQTQCSACHSATGNGIPDFDFSSPAFSQKLELEPDYNFWVVSEGRLEGGMPSYKSSLSVEQRWQTLTFIHSLSTAPQTPVSPAPSVPSSQASSLTLLTSKEAQTGQNLAFAAMLIDAQNKPVSGEIIRYYLSEKFFADGQMEIGQATTDAQGQAILYYVPKIAGEQTLVAKSQTLESEATLSISDSGQNFYQSEAGIHLRSIGPEVFIGPESAHELGEMGNAPAPALHLPGGIFSWLWLYIGVAILVWGVYFIVLLQILRISGTGVTTKFISLTRRINTRLVPLVGLVLVFVLGLVIVLMIITGPYSHFHLAP